MAKLTDEIKALLDKQLVCIATAGKDGIPNVGPKGSMIIVDDDTIAYSESTARKTLANLRENPRVSVLVADRTTGRGYQLKGKAEILASGELYDRIAKRQAERKRSKPNQVVRIKIEEIFPV